MRSVVQIWRLAALKVTAVRRQTSHFVSSCQSSHLPSLATAYCAIRVWCSYHGSSSIATANQGTWPIESNSYTRALWYWAHTITPPMSSIYIVYFDHGVWCAVFFDLAYRYTVPFPNVAQQFRISFDGQKLFSKWSILSLPIYEIWNTRFFFRILPILVICAVYSDIFW
jgi:hypothetical protein